MFASADQIEFDRDRENRERRMEKKSGSDVAKPTGCFKCGRPGHWSRDCPDHPTQNPNHTSSSSTSTFKTTTTTTNGGSFSNQSNSESVAKPRKKPKPRPKLTPELLLSNDGLGYILKHFPRSFKYHGRGHEFSDLEKLIGLYSEWHSHLLPYYSFEQFIHKVEQVGATRHVRTSLRELRERVANGGDPTKLHEPPVEHNDPNHEPVEAYNLENPTSDTGNPPMETRNADAMDEEFLEMMQNDAKKNSLETCDADTMDEELLDEMLENDAKKESLGTRDADAMIEEFLEMTESDAKNQPQSQSQVSSQVHLNNSSADGSSYQVPANEEGSTEEIQITEEKRALMEARRLKALEIRAARARSSQAA